MRMPGFAAEASLYRSINHYPAPGSAGAIYGVEGQVVPSIAPGACRYECSRRYKVCRMFCWGDGDCLERCAEEYMDCLAACGES